jgi:hypothetical protein
VTRRSALCAGLWLAACSASPKSQPGEQSDAGSDSSVFTGGSSAIGGTGGPSVGGSPGSGGSPDSGGSGIGGNLGFGGAGTGGLPGTGGAGVGGSLGTGGSGVGGDQGVGGDPGSGGTGVGGDFGSGGSSSGGDAGGSATGGTATGDGGSSAGGSGQSGSGGSVTGLGGAGGEIPSDPDACADLETYLAVPRSQRGPIEAEPFADVPLTLEQADQCAALLWEDFDALVRETRQAEHDNHAITLGDHTLRYEFTFFGDKPAAGWSLFISLHGGGNADPSVNDEQWQNQMTLYQPEEGIYLCPRAPTDTWNLWHEAHIDPLLQRLVSDLIVLEDVNPDRVYVMGYSAGGDGVYQLGPRMADHWAAAAAMAGHPNDAQPYSLRNIGFTIHVGELDTDYDRNLVAQEWSDRLDQLAAADPGGYEHVVQIHADKPHWMDLEDAVAVPWMAGFTRNSTPSTIVWYQDDVPHTSFYWLGVDEDQAIAATEVRATLAGQAVTLETTGLSSISVRLSDSMLDLSQPVTISANGTVLYEGLVSRTISTIAGTIAERGDPRLVFTGEQTVDL